MAAGDVKVFDQFREDLGNGVHNLGSNTFKVALIDNTITPLESTANPTWGSSGTTNLATYQVTPGGDYTSGGKTLGGVSFGLSGGRALFKANTFSVTQNVSNPTDANWAIIYNDTASGKPAVAFVDLGGVKDLTTTSIELRWDGEEVNGEIFRI